MCACVFLYYLGLLGARGPERAHAEDEEDEEQHRDDGDDGDVAGVGQKGRVGSLSRNHVGQIQHVAQRPAGVAAFYLDTAQEEGRPSQPSFTDVLQLRGIHASIQTGERQVKEKNE